MEFKNMSTEQLQATLDEYQEYFDTVVEERNELSDQLGENPANDEWINIEIEDKELEMESIGDTMLEIDEILAQRG